MAVQKELRIQVKVDRNTGELSVINDDLEKIEKSTKKAGSSIDLFGGHLTRLATIAATALSAGKIIEYADTWNLLEGRLSLVTSSTENLTEVQNELFIIAQNARVGFESTADLYARLARSTESLGVSQRETLSVTDTISKSLIISGSSAQAADAALMQLGQAFASGTLRGEELNSILEQAPRLAEAIAEGMGVTVGQLKNMGAEGQLTAEKVFEAIQKQKNVIEKEFAKMPETIGQAMTKLENQFMKLVGETDNAINGSGGVVNLINGISSTLAENQESIAVYAEILVSGLLQLITDISSTIGEVLNFTSNLLTGFINFFVDLVGDGSKDAENNFGFFDYFALGIQTALAGIGILMDGLKQLINYSQMAWAYVNGDDAGVAKAKAKNIALMKSEDERIDKLINSYKRLNTAKNEVEKPKASSTLNKKGTKLYIPKSPSKGKNSKTGKSDFEKANDDINKKIYDLTHSEHEKAIKQINDEAEAYRKAKVSEVKIAEFKTAAIAELTKKESDEANKENEKKIAEAQKLADKKFQAEEATYLDILEMSDNWLDKELYNIGKQVSEKYEAGMEIVDIEKWVNASIVEIQEKQAEEEADAIQKAIDAQRVKAITMQDVFENTFYALENTLVDFFQNGKFEADKFFEGIISDLIRMQIRMQITMPLMQAMGAGGFGFFADGGVFNGGQQVTAFANGGTFTNSIVSQPTLAPMALFGEAGEEAIMPLTRIGGTLGVKSTGAKNNQNVQINIQNNSGTAITEDNVRTSFDSKGLVVDIVLDAINRNKSGLRDTIKGVR